MRKVEVKVIPNAKRTAIKTEGSLLKVYLTAPALEGRANELLLEVLAEHWGVKKRSLSIIKGLHSRLKTINISEF